ncbi:MAG TPA: SAM-dependent methyltransferase, partial [Rhodospirillaceae bacterium]|nr:SAM-dependent methyltransferase [Rhodospirillaceae bacterium]
MSRRSQAVQKAEEYYDSSEADAFYKNVWGGEDIHIGIYNAPDEDIAQASRRTVETMALQIPGLGRKTRILDLGAGYGGSARHLAGTYGCRVTCLNLSETQNDLNRDKNAETDLDALIDVVHGSFEDIPAEDASVDLVWSQDAILHSGDRPRVLDEISRVLAPGGHVIFTDPMQADDVPDGVLQPILDRI